jgi:hypothetical protein
MFELFFILAVLFDAMQDAYSWEKQANDGTGLKVKRWQWHPIKNIGNLFFMIAGSWFIQPEDFLIGLSMSPALFVMWRMVYRYMRVLPLLVWTFNLSEFIPVQLKHYRYGSKGELVIVGGEGAEDIKWLLEGTVCLAVFFGLVLVTALTQMILR